MSLYIFILHVVSSLCLYVAKHFVLHVTNLLLWLLRWHCSKRQEEMQPYPESVAAHAGSITLQYSGSMQNQSKFVYFLFYIKNP